MSKQKTLKQSFSLTGKGLHTGLNISVTFNPAPENHGYKIKRIDLEEQPIIDAVAENVMAVQRGTIIGKENVQISTVEHGLAALYAFGIDNCLIEVDAPEFPILEGSAIRYVEEIKKAGTEEQNAPKDYFIIKKKIEIKDETTGASLLILPDDQFSVNVLISFDSPILSNQYATLENLDDFESEIAASRTFVFVREIESLMKANLIKGGDLDNAIVIYDEKIPQRELDRIADLAGISHLPIDNLGYVNNKPLVFTNEPARHKLLDIIGDMALIGKPLKGRIIATRPGHKINNQFARLIRKEIKLHEVQAPVYRIESEPVMDICRIKELLPHRFPFLLVDKIIELGGKHIVGVKNITVNEPFFPGHFPGRPVMPGVLIVEALAQVGAVAIKSLPEMQDKLVLFAGIDEMRFKKQVLPGDTLRLEVQVLQVRSRLGNGEATAYVGETVAAKGKIMFALVNM